MGRRKVSCLTVAWVMLTAGSSRSSTGTTHIYLDFLQVPTTLSAAPTDDASKDQARLAPTEPLAAFPWDLVDASEARETTINRVAMKVGELFAPFDIFIHLTRPTGIAYTMVVVGGQTEVPTAIEGLSLIDCNNDNLRNVSFIFAGGPDPSIAELAIAISHELGHSFGLEHTSLSTDIMFAERGPDRIDFQDQTAEVTPPNDCSIAVQNSHARLLEILGPRDLTIPLATEQLPEPVQMGGCAIGPVPAAPTWELRSPSLVVAFAVLRWRRLRRVAPQKRAV